MKIDLYISREVTVLEILDFFFVPGTSEVVLLFIILDLDLFNIFFFSLLGYNVSGYWHNVSGYWYTITATRLLR